MFASPNYVDVVAEAQRKRAREEEEDAGHGSMSFGEHRNKRIQCLPLRTSPGGAPQLFSSSAITPLNSDSDENLPRSHFSPWSSSPGIPSSQPEHNYNEMDMVDASPSLSHQQLASTRSHLTVAAENANGRLPTPIQPSFAAQVRGQQCEWAGPGPAVRALNGVVNMGHHQTGFADDQYVPRAMAMESDWQTIQNNRRLPSPISEGDDCMCNSPLNSPSMVLDNGFQDQLASDMETPTLSPQPSPPRTMEHPNAMMDIETRSAPESSDNDEDPTTPSPNRRGHIRSRHTVNNWTWQPGMKKSFSIGYRSDCEKCRLKVPGHFNHIIIS